MVEIKNIIGSNFSLKNTCVAYGHFDGMHLGHRELINKLCGTGKQQNLNSVLITATTNSIAEKVITTDEEKSYLLQSNGPDVTIFDKMKIETTESFIRNVLLKQLGAKVLVVSEDNAEIGVLRSCASKFGYQLIECPTATVDKKAVTSKRILAELENNNVEKAAELLGHNYFVMGEVGYGKQIGRTVGLPTANITYKKNKYLIPDGVYAVMTEVDGVKYKGLCNIGRRPSVDSFDYITVENHLLDYNADLYGKVIKMDVHFYIRPVMKMNGMDEVLAQVKKDLQAIRGKFEKME